MNAPNQMIAAVLEAFVQPLLIKSLDRPKPAANQVMVRVIASGLNPLDTKIQAGEASHAKHPPPAVLGIDMAGVVEAVGSGVVAWSKGDLVCGMTGGVGGHPGSLSQYALADAELIARKPSNLTMREAAALPLAFITAWEGLVDRAAVESGQSVLIQGGAGGVGHLAIQIALAHGAKVFATGSTRSLPFIASLGAIAIDRAKVAQEDYVAQYTGGCGFDLIYDTVGGVTLDASFAAVRRFGHVVSALGWGMHALAPLSFRAASYSGVFTLLPLLTGKGLAHHGQIMRQATKLAEAGQLKPRLDPRRFGLADANDALQAVAEGGPNGKIVVEIEPD